MTLIRPDVRLDLSPWTAICARGIVAKGPSVPVALCAARPPLQPQVSHPSVATKTSAGGTVTCWRWRRTMYGSEPSPANAWVARGISPRCGTLSCPLANPPTANNTANTGSPILMPTRPSSIGVVHPHTEIPLYLDGGALTRLTFELPLG